MVSNDKVVSMNYTLRNGEGDVVDESGGEPLEYLHGHQNIIPGLEKCLAGLPVGARKQVVIAPEDGYGLHKPDLEFELPRERFEGRRPEVGMVIGLQAPGGDQVRAQVKRVGDDVVHMDANHPLAGETLHFAVEIVGVREATREELAHGHVHGPGGHHHH